VKSEKIDISGKDFRYQALIGSQLMVKAGELIRERTGGLHCAIVADKNSARLFGERVRDGLVEQSFQPVIIVIAPGENSKSLEQVEGICNEMIAAGLDRTSFIVGLGGGVVGDVSGFAAAIFHRGIPHIQIPTTLLAMVDSAIGGKTGVNVKRGKNLLGALHHPLLVIADVDALDSLPPQELRQGYAEIIKHGIIRDAEMLRDLRDGRATDRAKLICRNIAIKVQIVSKDDRETSGERALLNFGHTIGHAIERAADFKIAHGDCVSLGMVAACHVSIKRAGLSVEECDEVVGLLQKFDLPTHLPLEIARHQVLDTVGRDKKFQEGKIRFVVTPRLGSAQISSEVTMEDIAEAIDQF
jgi:3-dehydroquinate synthase